MSEVSAAFRAIYACDAKELKELASRAKDIATTRPLTEKQIATRESIKAKIDDLGPVVEKTIAEKEQSLSATTAEREEAKSERDLIAKEVESVSAKVKEAQAALASKREELTAAEKAKDSNALSPVQRYSKFVQQRASFQADLKWRAWILKTLSEVDDAALRTVDLSDVFALTDEWEQSQADIDSRISELAKEGEALREIGAPRTDVNELQAKWDDLKRVKADQDSRLQKERERRHEMEDNTAAFVKEQGKLLQWCRQQLSQLESLKQPEHVQEFCASLQSNNSTMEANFLVLSDMAEGLLPNETVSNALVEVSREWFNLQLYTYERLRACLMEQHHRSKVEDELRAWSAYAAPVKEYLETVEGFLQQPSEDEAVAYIGPLLESCKALQNEYMPHQLIADHIADFSLRMQCLQDNYNALRPSVFAPLSLLYQSLSVGTTSWKRKDEYNQKVNELAEWIDVKGQTDTWKDLLGRVNKIKQLIEENEAAQGLEDSRH